MEIVFLVFPRGKCYHFLITGTTAVIMKGEGIMDEVLRFLKENRTFYVATMDGDQPRVRPFGAAAVWQGRLYIVTNNQKKVFNQLQKNPRIEISAADNKGNWVRITGSAVLDPSREARVHMLDENAVLKGMYSADDGLMEVLYLEDATAVFESLSGGDPKQVRL